MIREDTRPYPQLSRARPAGRGNRFDQALKRALDLAASLVGLILLAPFFGLAALLIKRDSPGPVFYRGERAARGGGVFRILKFRTMHEEAASYAGPRVTAQDDPRVTGLGRWLRDSKVNELPQLWNVLVGEMSLVGPRPEDPALAAEWPPALRQEVLSVRPGITSPASVLYRDEERMLSRHGLMDDYLNEIAPSKLRLDQLYVRNRSFLLDLDVLFWTFVVLLRGGSQPPVNALFLGPFTRLMRRYLNWFVIDGTITFLAFGAAGLMFRLGAPLHIGWGGAIALALGFAALFSLVAAAAGVQRTAWTCAPAGDALDLLPSTALAALFTLGLNHWLGLLPAGLVLTASGLALTGFIFARYRSRILTGAASRWIKLRGPGSTLRERVLIVGSGEAGQMAAMMLSFGQSGRIFEVAGFVDDDLYMNGARLRGHPVLGHREDIPALVERFDVGVIVFAIHNIGARDRAEILRMCRRTPARVIEWPDLIGRMKAVLTGGGLSETLVDAPPGTWLSGLKGDLLRGDVSAALEKVGALEAGAGVIPVTAGTAIDGD